MFYAIWIISAFVAVGVGCWAAHMVDKKTQKKMINKHYV
jgi:uncharacterized membrane protein YgdD (TMEM256/DUF423 family)